MNKKWANKERGLRYYGKGKDVYSNEWYVQDGSWASFHGIRIYHSDCDYEVPVKSCLTLKKSDAIKLIKALQKAFKD